MRAGDSSCAANCDPSTKNCSNKQVGEDMGNRTHCARMSYLVAGALGFSFLTASANAYSQTADGVLGKAGTAALEEIIRWAYECEL